MLTSPHEQTTAAHRCVLFVYVVQLLPEKSVLCLAIEYFVNWQLSELVNCHLSGPENLSASCAATKG